MKTEIIMVASGKGGVGKSTVCTMLGAALASLGKKVLLIEMDNGLRGLDIMNGVHNKAIFDLHDLLDGSVPSEKAILPSSLQPNLFVLSGSLITDFVPTADKLIYLFNQLDGQYDFIFLDCPAGIGTLFTTSVSVCNLAIIVVTPDFLTVR
ncbi:MAG: AAA family ATPase, partial [Oscillospiraceae bacterium]